jgi:hypothetical protein
VPWFLPACDDDGFASEGVRYVAGLDGLASGFVYEVHDGSFRGLVEQSQQSASDSDGQDECGADVDFAVHDVVVPFRLSG